MKLKLLSSETFTIETQDSIEVVRQRLVVQVEDSRTIRSLDRDCAVFGGQVTEHGFKIFKKANFFSRDNSLVTFNGSFEQQLEKTVIYVTANSHWFANFHYGTIFALLLIALLAPPILSFYNHLLNYYKIEELISSLLYQLYNSYIFIDYLRKFQQSFNEQVASTESNLTQIFLS
jgi:hypothetical protein